MGAKTVCQNTNCFYPKYYHTESKEFNGRILIINQLQEIEENKAAVKIQSQLRVKSASNKIPLLILNEIQENYGRKNISINQIEPSKFNSLLKSNISNSLDTLKSFEFIQDDFKKGNSEEKRPLYVIPCLKFTMNKKSKDIEDMDDNILYYYRGQWNCRGLKHGVGIIIENDSSIYYGHFINDLKQGKGILVKSNGDWYKGEFFDDEVNGQGTLNIFSEYLYNGQWRDNSKNGYGIEVYNDGSRYEGDFVNNLKQGKGLYTYLNGTYYEGKFDNSLFHGQGKFVWKDGKKYIGQFNNGKIEGKGKYIWPNGCEYNGEFRNMSKQGKGVMIFSQDAKLDGYWLQNKLHGKVEVFNKELYYACFRYGKMISSTQNKTKSKQTNCHHSSRIKENKQQWTLYLIE